MWAPPGTSVRSMSGGGLLRTAIRFGLAGTTPTSSLLRASAPAASRPVLALRSVVARGGSSSSGGKGSNKGGKMAEFRNPHNLPVKTCVVCNRPFTWRKKWERCWDEVTTCSKSCNAARKREKRADGAEDDVDIDQSDKGGSASDGWDAAFAGLHSDYLRTGRTGEPRRGGKTREWGRRAGGGCTERALCCVCWQNRHVFGILQGRGSLPRPHQPPPRPPFPRPCRLRVQAPSGLAPEA